MAKLPSHRDRTARRSGRGADRAAAQEQQFAQWAQWPVLVVAGQRIAFASRQAEQLLGHVRGGLSGRNVRSVIARKDAARLVRGLRGEGASSRAQSGIELLAGRNVGGQIWLEARPSTIPWNGKPALLLLLADISERKAAAAELSERARSYRQIVQSSRQGIAVLRDGKVLLANRALANLFGYPRARGIAAGTEFRRLVAPTDRARFKRTHDPARAARLAAAGTDYEGRRVDGNPVWFQSLAQRVEWEGKPAVLATIMDTTAPRQAEEALRANKRLLQTLLDAIPGRLFVTDTQGRYLQVNREQAEALGRRPQDLVGQPSVKWAAKLVTRAQAIGREERRVMRTGRALRVYARRETRPDGREFWAEVVKRPLRDDSGRVIGLVGLVFDVTEHHRAQEELRTSRQLLQTIFDAIPEPLFVKDLSGRFLKVNHAMARAYGASPEAMEGKPWSFVARVGADPIAVQKEDERVMRTGRRLDVPDTLRTTSLGDRWYRFVKVPLRDGKGKVIGLIALATDVTQRRHAEAALRAQQRLLRTTFDALPVGITVKDRAGKFLMVNRAHLRATGASEKSMLEKTLAELLWVPAWRRKVYTDLEAEVLRTKRPAELPELIIDRPGQKTGVARMVKVPILDDKGDVESIVTLWEDISERLAAEQELRRGRRLLRTVFDAIPHEMSVKDVAGRFLTANRAYAESFGVSEERMRGRTMDDLRLFSSALREELNAADRHVLSSRALVEVPEAQVERADGAQRTHRILKVPLLDEQGAPEGVVTLAEDITARKQAEQALLDNQNLLQAVLDAIPHNVFVKDPAGRVVLVNRAYARFWGTTDTRPNLHNRDIATLPRDHIDAWEASDRRVLEFGETVVSDGDEVTLPGGGRVWLRTVKAPRYDEHNRIIGLVGLSEDITARRTAELALRENQQILVSAQAIGHIGSWTSDLAGTPALHWSPEVYRIFDMQPEDFDNRFETFTARIHPADLQHFHEVRTRALKGEAAFDVEHRILRPDGTVRWVHERADVRRDAQGRPVQLVGVVQDITGQKEAALALRSQPRLIQAVFDTIPHEVFVKDRNSAFVLVNHSFAAFYGLSPEKVKGLSTRNLPNVPSEIVESWIADDLRVMETGQPVDRREFRYRSADGRETWFDLRKFPWRDDENRIVGIVGVREDITERRHTEELVRANRRLLRTVFDTIPHLLYVKDRQGRYIMVNEALAQVYGRTPETMTGAHTLELPGALAEQRERLLEADRTVIETGAAVNQPEVPIYEGERGTHWYNIVKLPLRDEQSRIIGIVGMSEDITQRRRAEQELQTNRRLLRTVFDTIPHLLYVKDAQSRYLMVNAATASVYGLTPETMAGRHTLDLPFPPPEFRQRLVESDQAIIASGLPSIQQEVERDEGPRGKHWYSSIKLPLRDEQGRIVGIVGMSEDITQRRRAEHELQTSRRLLRAVFDAVPFWLMVRDRTGRATLVNLRMAEDYGVQPDAFLGKTMQEDPHLSAEEKAALESIDAEVTRTLRPLGVPELSLTLPGGRARLLRLVSIPLFDEAGEREGVLVLAEDITERKRSEQALLQAQKMESLGVLAGGIAHDFNNLLVAILGNASLALLKLKESAVGFPELKQIELAGQSAADLCRQMLAYAGKGPLEMQQVDVNQLVHEMTQLLRVSLPKGVAFAFRLAEALPPVQGDPTQIRQVIMNLVINAGEAIGDKQGSITLTTGTQYVDRAYLDGGHAAADAVEGRYVFLEVSDSGHGMGPETLARIFDPFFTTKFTGRGLGLASVIGIIRGHRGALRVYSELGAGSAFRVLLPALEGAGSQEPAAPPIFPWKEGGRVLLVDDEAHVLEVAQKMLTHLGFTVIPASDGAQALNLLRTERETLRAALIDLTMPGLSGEEVVREIRRIREDLPVLVMSGYSESDVQSRFRGRPNTGFLQKPFTLAALHAKMRALLGDPPTG